MSHSHSLREVGAVLPTSPAERRAAAVTVADVVLRRLPAAPREAQWEAVGDILEAIGLLETRPRRKHGRPRVDHGHGHPQTYAQGCRCDDCRAANAARGRDQRDRAAADPSVADRAGHGKAATYKNHGCRCAECRAAHSAELRARKASKS